MNYIDVFFAIKYHVYNPPLLLYYYINYLHTTAAVNLPLTKNCVNNDYKRRHVDCSPSVCNINL